MAAEGKKRIPGKWQSFHSFPLHCSLESVVITKMPTLQLMAAALQWQDKALPNVAGDGVFVHLADGELHGYNRYSCIKMRYTITYSCMKNFEWYIDIFVSGASMTFI
jgi:hypothetical protein